MPPPADFHFLTSFPDDSDNDLLEPVPDEAVTSFVESGLFKDIQNLLNQFIPVMGCWGKEKRDCQADCQTCVFWTICQTLRFTRLVHRNRFFAFSKKLLLIGFTFSSHDSANSCSLLLWA